jgi:Ca2+-binding EF-hand superfamily protein
MSDANHAMLMERFKQMDKDKSGFLDRAEIKEGLKAMGIRYSEKEIDEIFKSVDTNGNGQVEYEGRTFAFQYFISIDNLILIKFFSNQEFVDLMMNRLK